jgi:hypothetical protein
MQRAARTQGTVGDGGLTPTGTIVDQWKHSV